MYLIELARLDKSPTLTSIISESTPHLKRGAIRDFKNILQGHKLWDETQWNTTNATYKFPTGSVVEFFPADDSSKLRGARRDRCFINEANNTNLDAFDQLEVRTKDFIYLDWNPTSEFYFYTDILPKRQDVDFITLTYKDNEALSNEIIASIEARKNRKNWWKVYGLGELGETEGKIFKDWKIISHLPHRARLERYGVDFGYTNDPTSIIAVYYYDSGYIIDEIAFNKGLTNKKIADIIQSTEKPAITVCDSAEPKSIDELKSYGVDAVGVSKSKGESKDQTFNKWSIELVQNERISITQRSLNVIREYRNYMWDTDKDGNYINKPSHDFSHSMDAIRYAFVNMLKTYKPREFKQSSPLLPYYGDRDVMF